LRKAQQKTRLRAAVTVVVAIVDKLYNKAPL